MKNFVSTLLASVVLAACGTDPVMNVDVDSGLPDGAAADQGELPTDAGLDMPVVDLGVPDAGEVDAGDGGAGDIDAGDVDAGDVDAGDIDAGEVDAGDIDAGDVDAGEVDAGEVDAGEVDAGEVDAGELDAGEVDAGEVDMGPPPPAFEILSCSGLSPSISVTNTGSTAWNPSSATIASGEVVRWSVSGSAHNVVSGTVSMGVGTPDGRFNVTLNPGESLCIQFNDPGSYGFYCDTHTSMKGTITVIGL